MTHLPLQYSFDGQGWQFHFIYIWVCFYRYNRTHEFTQKSDVYGFGVVLLEIICGRPAVVPSLPTQEEVHIVEWVRNLFIINQSIV